MGNMAKKKKSQDPIPYVIEGSTHSQNVRFYERYDADFLFNKVATLWYVINVGEQATEQIEAYILAAGGGKLSARYSESLRAELFFTALHQCETFFALLVTLFQPLPHWLYLTTYKPWQIKRAAEQIVANKISDLTSGAITTLRDFIKVVIYSEVVAGDPELAGKWDENIDNAAWLVERIGEFFLNYDRAYNSYKHGLRVMTGPHMLRIAPQNPDGTVQGPMHILQSSEDAVTYLEEGQVREVDGEKEIPISEVTKTFNPSEAFFYIAKINQMLETIKATRLARLRGDDVVPSINTFFGLDRQEVLARATHDEWTHGPMRADEARAYEQFVAQMRANAESAKRADETSGSDDAAGKGAE
jgi:hypothetical protein